MGDDMQLFCHRCRRPCKRVLRYGVVLCASCLVFIGEIDKFYLSASLDDLPANKHFIPMSGWIYTISSASTSTMTTNMVSYDDK